MAGHICSNTATFFNTREAMCQLVNFFKYTSGRTDFTAAVAGQATSLPHHTSLLTHTLIASIPMAPYVPLSLHPPSRAMQAVAVVQAAEQIVAGLNSIAHTVFGVIDMVERDRIAREKFAVDLCLKMLETLPSGSAALCICVEHDWWGPSWDRGEIIQHRVYLTYSTGVRHQYTLYVIPNGSHATFRRRGDGGYINWAVAGTFERGKGDSADWGQQFVWFPSKDMRDG